MSLLSSRKLQDILDRYLNYSDDPIRLYNQDNLSVELYPEIADVVYGDCIYESMDFQWVDKYWNVLKTGGVFIVQTDWHTVGEYIVKLKSIPEAVMINKIAWKCEWGNHPKDRFHQSYDDILIFRKGKDIQHKFYSDRIQIPKATAKTKLNPSGRETKTSTAFIDDICLTTTSNERIKKDDGHLIRWQKPLKLMDRILLPFTDEGDLVVDPYLGSGTTAEWCLRNKRYCVGLENDTEVFQLAVDRLTKVAESLHEQTEF